MTLRPCRRAKVNRVRRLIFQIRAVMSPVHRHPRLPPGFPAGWLSQTPKPREGHLGGIPCFKRVVVPHCQWGEAYTEGAT
jgi:hypothetical protein